MSDDRDQELEILQHDNVALRARLAEVERERDMAVSDSRTMVCCYCGEIRQKPEPFTKETMGEEILAHLDKCPTHPFNAFIQAQARVEELEKALKRLLSGAEKYMACKPWRDADECFSEARAALQHGGEEKGK